LLALASSACKAAPNAAPRSPVPKATVSAAGLALADFSISRGKPLVNLEVEVADTDATQRVGLMNRKHLGKLSGMAFVWPQAFTPGFYMKDTLIPLDIAFWDQTMKIVDIKQMEPCPAEPCPIYLPVAPALGALEVNKGLLDRHGVKVGDEVRLTGR
jgi:uncharacterized protein